MLLCMQITVVGVGGRSAKKDGFEVLVREYLSVVLDLCDAKPMDSKPRKNYYFG